MNIDIDVFWDSLGGNKNNRYYRTETWNSNSNEDSSYVDIQGLYYKFVNKELKKFKKEQEELKKQKSKKLSIKKGKNGFSLS